MKRASPLRRPPSLSPRTSCSPRSIRDEDGEGWDEVVSPIATDFAVYFATRSRDSSALDDGVCTNSTIMMIHIFFT